MLDAPDIGAIPIRRRTSVTKDVRDFKLANERRPAQITPLDHIPEKQRHQRRSEHLEPVESTADRRHDARIVDDRKILDRPLCRNQHGQNCRDAEDARNRLFPAVQNFRRSGGGVGAKALVAVEQKASRIMRGRCPDEEQQNEKQHDVPGILDQLDEQILGLRHQIQQCDPEQKRAQRNAHDPKDQCDVEHLAPRARHAARRIASAQGLIAVACGRHGLPPMQQRPTRLSPPGRLRQNERTSQIMFGYGASAANMDGEKQQRSASIAFGRHKGRR